MLHIFLRTVLAYFFVIFAIRLMGKRQVGELQPTEFVISLLIAELASLPLQDGNLPVSYMIIPICTLVSFEYIFSSLSLSSNFFHNLVSGKESVVIADGIIDQAEMTKVRLTVDDLFEAMRGKAVRTINDVEYAVLETNGELSFFLYSDKNQSLYPSVKGFDVPVIKDGQLENNALKLCGISRDFVDAAIKKQGLSSPKEIFIMCVDFDLNVTIIRKDTGK